MIGEFSIYDESGTTLQFSGVAKDIQFITDSLATPDSGRNAQGNMILGFIKPVLRKWEITMAPDTPSAIQSLISAIQGKKYKLTIHDITTGQPTNKILVYTSKTSAEAYNGALYYKGVQGIITDFKFNAIEV